METYWPIATVAKTKSHTYEWRSTIYLASPARTSLTTTRRTNHESVLAKWYTQTQNRTTTIPYWRAPRSSLRGISEAHQTCFVVWQAHPMM
jgi:hypothetical protein